MTSAERNQLEEQENRQSRSSAPVYRAKSDGRSSGVLSANRVATRIVAAAAITMNAASASRRQPRSETTSYGRGRPRDRGRFGSGRTRGSARRPRSPTGGPPQRRRVHVAGEQGVERRIHRLPHGERPRCDRNERAGPAGRHDEGPARRPWTGWSEAPRASRSARRAGRGSAEPSDECRYDQARGCGPPKLDPMPVARAKSVFVFGRGSEDRNEESAFQGARPFCSPRGPTQTKGTPRISTMQSTLVSRSIAARCRRTARPGNVLAIAVSGHADAAVSVKHRATGSRRSRSNPPACSGPAGRSTVSSRPNV